MAQNSPASASSVVTMRGRPFANENNPEPSEQPPAVEASAVARKFMAAVKWAERKNAARAPLGNPAVYDPQAFPWVAELENSWTGIRAELAQLMLRRDALAAKQSGQPAKIGEDRAWTTFVLANYFQRYERNIAQCPETWRILQKVPRLVGAMFSVLEPGRRLPPHRGPYNGVLRLHLGLIIPEPREAVAIRINGKVHHWEEGRALIFDDTFEHEVRNESDYTRVVLFVDFEKPLKFPARLINRRLLRSYLFRPFVREGAESQGRWAQRFYRQAQELREAERAPAAADVPVAIPPAAAARPVAVGKRTVEKSPAEKRPVEKIDDAPLSLTETFERHWPSDTTKV
jgi:beta-hydroxylase